jgi:hypothetical protein
LLVLIAAAWLAGCDDDSTPPVADQPAAQDPCLDCHGDRELLMAMLPEEVARITTRGDG